MNEKLDIVQERIKSLINDYCEGSQQKFADRCGISKYSVSQYVNGSNAPGNVSAAKIAKAFDLDPLWVMGFDVPMFLDKRFPGHTFGLEQEDYYYINEETRKLAQFLFENPGHRVLLDASRDLRPEDLEFVMQMINRMKNQNS